MESTTTRVDVMLDSRAPCVIKRYIDVPTNRVLLALRVQSFKVEYHVDLVQRGYLATVKLVKVSETVGID